MLLLLLLLLLKRGINPAAFGKASYKLSNTGMERLCPLLGCPNTRDARAVEMPPQVSAAVLAIRQVV